MTIFNASLSKATRTESHESVCGGDVWKFYTFKRKKILKYKQIQDSL